MCMQQMIVQCAVHTYMHIIINEQEYAMYHTSSTSYVVLSVTCIGYASLRMLFRSEW